MRHILHIKTKVNDALAETVIKSEQSLRDTKIETVELTTQVDYEKLVQQIFAADSVQVW